MTEVKIYVLKFKITRFPDPPSQLLASYVYYLSGYPNIYNYLILWNTKNSSNTRGE